MGSTIIALLSFGRSCVFSLLEPVTTNYASAFAYDPAGHVIGFNHGNGVTARFSYSAERLPLVTSSYAKSVTNV